MRLELPSQQQQFQHQQPHQQPQPRPVSPAERQFWFAERIAPGSPAWRVLSAIRVEGPLDRAALTEAARRVVARHPALRSVFTAEGGRLLRTVLPVAAEPPLLPLAPGAGFRDAERALSAPDLLDLDHGRHLALALAPDPGAAEADGAPDTYATAPVPAATLYVLTHHIAYDGLSHEVFTADLARAYARTVAGEPELPEPPRSHGTPPEPSADRREELVAYWRAALDGVPDLPVEGHGPSQRELAGAEVRTHRVRFADGLGPAVRDAARSAACPPFAVLLTAYGQALAELSGADDFCVGTPVSLRTPDQAGEIGCLLTTLPVRLRHLDAPGALPRVWETFTDGVLHMELPYDETVRATRTRPSRRMPLHQALFAYESWQRPLHPAGPVRMHTVPVYPLGAQAEIQFQLNELPGARLEGVLQAPADGVWADRLPALAAAVTRRLVASAPNAPTIEEKAR